MMREDSGSDRTQRRYLLHEPVTDMRVQFDHRELLRGEIGRLEQDAFADPDLANVVQE